MCDPASQKCILDCGAGVRCGAACCVQGQVCLDETKSACAQDCGSGARCGSACCVQGQVCFDEAKSACAQDCGSGVRCGSACCGVGQVCLDEGKSACAQDCGAGVRCGAVCCVQGQVCDSMSNTCILDCGPSPRCGSECCGVGQRCDEEASKCVVDCETVGGKNCGTVCCYGSQVCDEASGTCACDMAAGAASTDTCGVTCCGVLTPNCVTENGTQRCSVCTDADVALECGPLCMPPGQTCLNKATGAFGTAWGKAKQSCAGGLVCPVPDGKGGMEMADCCESIVVPEATFTMGGKASEVDGLPANDGKSYQATVSTYALDRFEVTVGRFRKFVEAYDGLVAQGLLPEGAGANKNVGIPAPGTGWQTGWNAKLPQSKAELVTNVSSFSGCIYADIPGANETKPMNCVNWYQAFAFCAWDGGRLPTEAEWEMAASNGSAQSVYPWGDSEPTDALAVFRADGCSQIIPIGDCPQGPMAVGSKPAGANQLGHRDLAGNVYEWVLDTYVPYPTQESKNYVNSQSLSSRVVRGDAWGVPYHMSAASRNSLPSVLAYDDSGLRCARTPLHEPARLFLRRCYLPFP